MKKLFGFLELIFWRFAVAILGLIRQRKSPISGLRSKKSQRSISSELSVKRTKKGFQRAAHSFSQPQKKVNPIFLGTLLVTLLIASLTTATASSQPIASGQKNFLFVLVEDAQEENTELLGIWMAATHLESGAIHWMPIYPNPINFGDNAISTPHSAHLISPKMEANWHHLELVRKEGLWWDEIILADKGAISQISPIIGHDLNLETDTWQEPQAALYEHVMIIQSICNSKATIGSREFLNSWLHVLDKDEGLQTSINHFDLIALWDAHHHDFSAMTCLHPWAD